MNSERRASELFASIPAATSTSHRPAVRGPDGPPVDCRHRVRALGVAAHLGRRASAAPTSTSRRRSSSAGSSRSFRRCSRSLRPGLPSTRYTIATAQMLMGALLIHLTGGRIETHFHVFGSLAFLAFYRDWRVLVPATIVVALDHFLRGDLLAAVGLRRAGRQPVALARARRLGRLRGHLPRRLLPAQRRPRCGSGRSAPRRSSRKCGSGSRPSAARR